MRKVPIPLAQRLADFVRGPLVLAVWLAAVGGTVYLVRQRPEPVDHLGWVPTETLEVTAPTTGTLAALLVEPLQRVRRGELLAQLDTRPLEARLATAQAQVEELGLRVEAATDAARLESERLASELARETAAEERRWAADLRRYVLDEVQLQIELLEVQVELADDRVASDLLGVRLRRARRLAEEGIGPESDVEDLDLRQRRTDARIAANEVLLEQQRRELAAAEARRAGFELRAPADEQPARVPSDVRALEAAVRVQSLRVEELALEREGLALSAPLDGQVTAVLVGEGQAVLAGRPVLLVSGGAAEQAVVFVDPAVRAETLVGRRVALRGRDRADVVVESQVATVGPGIELLPERLWPSPSLPLYGRAVRVPLPQSGPFVPGEVLGVRVLPESAP